MDTKLLLQIVAGALFIVGFVFSAIFIVLRFAVSKTLNDWSDAIRRIPEQKWFDSVQVAINELARQVEKVANNTEDIIGIKEDMKSLEADFRVDQRTLVTLKAQHDFIYTNCAGKLRGVLDSNGTLQKSPPEDK